MQARLLLFIISLCAITTYAQTNSPFSIGSAGFPLPTNTVNSTGLGEVLPAYYQKEYVNTSNPATYSSFYLNERTSFTRRTLKDTVEIIDGQRKLATKVDSVISDTILFTYKVTSFQAGILTDYETFSQNGNNFSSGSASLQYLTFSLPIPKIGGMVFGLQQQSKLNYQLSNSVELADTTLKSITNLYNGKGGIFTALAGIGAQYKNTSIGFQLNYAFGTPTKTQVSYYPTQQNTAGALYEQAQIVSGVFYNFGIHQQFQFRNGSKLMIGGSFRPYAQISARNKQTQSRVFIASEEAYNVLDTSFFQISEGFYEMPQQIQAGISIQDLGYFNFHTGYQMEKWSETQHEFANTSLSDAYQFNFGTRARFTNEPFTRKFFLNNFYTAGFQMGNIPLALDGNQYSFTGISVGLGIPIQQRFPKSPLLSVADFGFSWRSYSNGNSASARMNQFQFSLGLNLNDNFWIFKQKYD